MGFVFPTRLWLSCDEVDDVLKWTEHLRAQLGPEGFITASISGLWAILGTPGGQLTVDKMLQTLDKQGFITASNDGLWAILCRPGGQLTVDTMMQYTGEYFLLMTKGGFWSQMLKNGTEFDQCLRQAVDAFGMCTIARIMATCASRFCDEPQRQRRSDNGAAVRSATVIKLRYGTQRHGRSDNGAATGTKTAQ